MAVRNFWVEIDCDGRKEKIATGPRSSTGTMEIKLKMRQKGKSKEVLTLWCRPKEENGELVCSILLADKGELNIFDIRTIR